MVKSKRQTFEKGDIVFLCISRGSNNYLPSWMKAVVVQYPAEECLRARGFGYHRCDPKIKTGLGECNIGTDPTRVKIHRLDRNGKKSEGAWSRETINNTRSKILTLEEGEPIMAELAVRKTEQEKRYKERTMRHQAERRLDKAAEPMAEALRRIERGQFKSAAEASSIAATVLDLLEPPKEEEDEN